MALYTNTTRFSAVVTIEVMSVTDEQAALAITTPGATNTKLKAAVGHHDFIIEAGKSISLLAGTQAKFFAVRSCP